MKKAALTLLFPLLSLGLAACGGGAGPATAQSGVAEKAQAEASASAVATGKPAERPSPFAELVDKLSEPDGEFFSDNVISNETSYLQIASQLAKVARPG